MLIQVCFEENKMLIKLVILTLLSISRVNSITDEIIPDYTKANINKKKFYYQIPQDELILNKAQAMEPRDMFEGPLKGRGYGEPFTNHIILKLRQAGIDVYTDYFTNAKGGFYRKNIKYEKCSIRSKKFSSYKSIVLDYKKRNTQNGKFFVISIPHGLKSPIGLLGINPSKIPQVEKYKFAGTNIYNLKDILNDKELKTIHVTETGSAISEIIYANQNNRILLPQFKYRVYEFVASNAIQIPLMLRGKRMDWVDLSIYSDYYIKKLNITKDKIALLSYSTIQPSKITNDNYMIDYFECYGKNLAKLEKVINIINIETKQLRTNLSFWTKVLTNFANDFGIPYVSPLEFHDTSELFKLKTAIDRGDFDLILKSDLKN